MTQSNRKLAKFRHLSQYLLGNQVHTPVLWPQVNFTLEPSRPNLYSTIRGCHCFCWRCWTVAGCRRHFSFINAARLESFPSFLSQLCWFTMFSWVCRAKFLARCAMLYQRNFNWKQESRVRKSNAEISEFWQFLDEFYHLPIGGTRRLVVTRSLSTQSNDTRYGNASVVPRRTLRTYITLPARPHTPLPKNRTKEQLHSDSISSPDPNYLTFQWQVSRSQSQFSAHLQIKSVLSWLFRSEATHLIKFNKNVGPIVNKHHGKRIDSFNLSPKSSQTWNSPPTTSNSIVAPMSCQCCPNKLPHTHSFKTLYYTPTGWAASNRSRFTRNSNVALQYSALIVFSPVLISLPFNLIPNSFSSSFELSCYLVPLPIWHLVDRIPRLPERPVNANLLSVDLHQAKLIVQRDIRSTRGSQ